MNRQAIIKTLVAVDWIVANPLHFDFGIQDRCICVTWKMACGAKTLQTGITVHEMADILSRHHKDYAIELSAYPTDVISTPTGTVYVDEWMPTNEDIAAMLSVLPLHYFATMRIVQSVDVPVYV